MTQEELRDYVEFVRSQNRIPYDIYSELLDGIDTLEQEPCDDAISRQAVLDAMYELCDTGETLNENPWRDNPHIDAIADAINNLPSVTPQPKTGHWIKTREAVMGEGYMWFCSNCKHRVYQDSSRPYPSENYCPNCGTEMESEE